MAGNVLSMLTPWASFGPKCQEKVQEQNALFAKMGSGGLRAGEVPKKKQPSLSRSAGQEPTAPVRVKEMRRKSV